MRIVVDTNVVFSALLNEPSIMADLLLSLSPQVSFYAPTLLIEEIERYENRISAISKLKPDQIHRIKELIYNSLRFISLELISEESFQKAYSLTKDIDENDTPFVALSLELSATLLTGDKKLVEGLKAKGFNSTITARELFEVYF